MRGARARWKNTKYLIPRAEKNAQCIYLWFDLIVFDFFRHRIIIIVHHFTIYIRTLHAKYYKKTNNGGGGGGAFFF